VSNVWSRSHKRELNKFERENYVWG